MRYGCALRIGWAVCEVWMDGGMGGCRDGRRDGCALEAKASIGWAER